MSEIDRTTFDTLKVRMKAKFPVLLETYLRDADKYLALTAGADLPALIDAAHSLKSASGLLGLRAVHKAAETLEYAGKALRDQGGGDIGSLAPPRVALQAAFDAVKDDVRAELERARDGQG